MRWGRGEMGKRRDEMGKRRDGEEERWGRGEMEKRKDGEKGEVILHIP